MRAALASPEAVAAVITLVGALLAAYWGGRAGGRGAVAAAQTQNRGMADQGAINARRVVYAEFARDARALADGVHQYVMAAGPDVAADSAAYTQVLDRARWSYDVVSIEGPQSVREAAKLFIDQAVACRRSQSWHASVVAAFNKLDTLMLTDDGNQVRVILTVGQEMSRIRYAARALPQDWRSQARSWARNASTDLRARWQEERDRSPDGAPTFEDVAALVGLLRDHDDPAAPLNAAVQAGYLTSQDASKISTYAVTWAEEDDPRERVSRGLLPMQDALDAFVRKANRVLHPEESEEDSEGS
ncbi:hypothetical protein ACFWWC_48855 [Streptomyces sp. NPDC058642]|uniref:hypothetical protein n=1 Tax=Streptomyces sp. NPDC058642 TaxID=3346572 RepID=UPI00364AF81D